MVFSDKRIAITGGAGFLGSHVVEEFQSRDYSDIHVPRSTEYDLRSQSAIKRFLQDVDPDVLIHLAGTVGGIGVMEDKPGEIFYDNATMGIELIEAARVHGVEKFVSIGSVCSYPKYTPVPFEEENLWEGYPEETHAPYGIAKKLPSVQCKAYRQQYGFNGIYLLPTNLYGPRDDFGLKTAHVIPAIIRKVDRAQRQGHDSITAWGTGEPTREFLFVEDAATAIVEATESYDKPDPVNLGTEEEISIKELIEMIVDKMGYTGRIEWDTSKPDGQPRRCLDTSRAEEELAWSVSTSFEEGLKETIDWFKRNCEELVE